MNFKNFQIVFCAMFLLICSDLFSQDKKIMPAVMEVTPSMDEHSDRTSDPEPDPLRSEQIKKLSEEMMSIKRSGKNAGIMQIQQKLDMLTGSVTEIPEEMELTLVKNEGPMETDNINSNFVSSVTGVKGIATCTEQIGSSAGRIWTAFVYGPNSGATPDNLRLCYKDFGGNSWNQWATIAFSPNNRMKPDQIDAEIIEDNTGDKFLWVAFGYISSANLWRIGVTIVKITGTLNYSGYTLAWPGTVNTNYYHKPRIVSDNEAYHSNPWIYITACEDSAVAGGYYAGEKVAICYSPFTVTPAFTYKATSFIGLLFRYPSDFTCDIAFFRNGGQDSILIVESSLADSSKIILGKTSIGQFVTSAQNIGNISAINNRRCYQAYIASAGGYNNLMIVNLRKFNDTDWDIEYYSSTNGSRSWTNSFVDYRTNYSTRADIIGFRSAPGTYACAYSDNNVSFVPVVYSYCESNVWQGLITPTNHINTNPFTAQPRPGISYGVTSENCFSLWTEYSGSTNVWSSTGCSGPVKVQRNIFFRGVIQGFWDAPADTMRNDTVTLYLRNDFAPYSIVDSSKKLLDNDGYGNFLFYNAQNFVNYYIVAAHRNSIDTWSASTFQFTSGSTSSSYDFTFSSIQAYGVNEVQVDVSPDLYAFYNGDVNRDAVINLADIIQVFNDAGSFVLGYVVTDLTGDNVTNLTDLIIAYNNSSKFVALIRP